jgi:uncharacterized membrane protein YccC
MAKSGHLWAIGYDNMERADQVRDEIISLGWGTTHYLILDDVAVVVRHPDGSFTFNREEFPAASNVLGYSAVGFLAGLVLGAPMTGATIGTSNQKGILRFGGAAVGGVMGLVALVYLFPNVETIGGFWLVFGAGTAVAAWVNFGTPRISYGGYQIGLAFYKAVLQGFGPALSATVVRDRLIGVFFGLIVYGVIERLRPVRAQDALRARLAEMLRLLADLARPGTSDKTPVVIGGDVDSWRRRIAQKVEDIQGLIESSKFESRALDLDALQKHTGDAQIVFVLLLSLARQRQNVTDPNIQAAAVELDNTMAMALQARATQLAGGSEPAVPELEDALNVFERSVVAAPHLTERLALYRALVAAIKRLSSEPLNAGQDGHEVRVLAVQ